MSKDKASKNSTTEQKLSSTEKQLLEYAKKGKPVLLYGEDLIGRKDLIKRIHEMNGGINKAVEKFYRVGNNKELLPYNEEKWKPLQKKDRKITYCLSSTPKTLKKSDCRIMSSEDVYKMLVSSEIKQNDMYVYMGMVPKGLLFIYKGSIFLDNLKCKNDNDYYYRRLSKIIEESKTKKHVTNQTTYKWLVVYTHKIKDFPHPFLEQFEEIPLSPEPKTEAEQQEGRITQADGKDITSKTLSMDDKNNALYFDKNKIAILKPEEINLIKYMQEQEAFELEQILTGHFKIKLAETYKHSKTIGDINSAKPTIEQKSRVISKGDRNKFEVYKANINKKCRTLGMNELIQNAKRGSKVFKLSRKIEMKYLNLNEFLNSNKI